MARTLSSKSVEFKLLAPAAKKVSLAGSFNNWKPKATLKKSLKGDWSAKINLKPGRYEYKFVVDGNWINDPSSPQAVGNPFGTQNSVIEIK